MTDHSDPTGTSGNTSGTAAADVDVLAAFNAKLEVGVQMRMDVPEVELLRARARVKRQVRECAKCQLRSKCAGPVPIRGPVDQVAAKVLVVGEAPGKREDERGLPFVGPAGKLMVAMMGAAGFEEDEVAWCNVVSCLSDGPPSVESMRACRSNLRDQVVASGAEYVVLAGSTALGAWRGDLKVGDVHGMVGIWGRVWVVMPTWHPAAVLRNPALKVEVINDLTRYRGVVEAGEKVSALGKVCVKCGDGDGVHWDVDGVCWCERHWMKYGWAWKKEWERWSNDRAVKRVAKKLRVVEGQQDLLVENSSTRP